jgi:hypothetical protein
MPFPDKRLQKITDAPAKPLRGNSALLPLAGKLDLALLSKPSLLQNLSLVFQKLLTCR